MLSSRFRLQQPPTQYPVDPRSLDMHLGPLGAQVAPDSGVFTAPDAENYGRNSFDRPYYEDTNPRDRIQPVAAAAPGAENPFDQFDVAPTGQNPFDQFDAPQTPATPQTPGNYGMKDEALSALTLGTSDEIQAGALAPIEYAVQNLLRSNPTSFGEAYDTNLDKYRGEQDAYREENPGKSLLGNLLGGLTVGGAVGPLAKGGNLLATGAKGLAAGAGLGFASGFGEGEGGFENRVNSGAAGAMIGGPLGAVAGPLATGAGAVVRKAGNMVRRGGIAKEVGSSPAAVGRVERAMTDDSLTPLTAKDRLGEMGDAGMLADLGPNLQRQAGAIASMPGKGQETLRTALETRAKGAGGRIEAASDAALAPRQDMAQTIDELVTRRGTESAPLYEKALNRPIAWDGRLQALTNDPVMRDGLKRGVEIQRLESLARNEPFDPATYALNEAGEPVGVPNMRTMNVVKKGLDDIIEGYRDPVTGKLRLDERGRAINEVQRAFIQKLDEVNPDYATARAAWSGPTRVRSAMSEGQDLFSKSVRPDVLRQKWAKMTDDEHEAYVIGARDAIDEIMGTARNDPLAARAALEKGWNREKLQIVLGPERANALLKSVDNEGNFSATRGVVSKGPETAARHAAQNEFSDQPVRSGVREGYMFGGTLGALRSAGVRGAEGIATSLRGASRQQTGSEVADLLSSPEPLRLLDSMAGREGQAAQWGKGAEGLSELARAMLLSPTAGTYAARSNRANRKPN